MCGASWVECGKNPLANTGNMRDASSIPTLGRSRGRGHGNPLQYSCLENSMVAGTWGATVHRLAKSRSQLKRLSTCTHTQDVCRFLTALLNRFYCVSFTQALLFQVMVFFYNFFFFLACQFVSSFGITVFLFL